MQKRKALASREQPVTIFKRSGSRHQGGAHVLMGDGAVKFVTDSIEAGNPATAGVFYNNNAGGISPYGVWGAYGSRNGKETIDSDESIQSIRRGSRDGRARLRRAFRGTLAGGGFRVGLRKRTMM